MSDARTQGPAATGGRRLREQRCQVPRRLTSAQVAGADLVVVLGPEAVVEPVGGTTVVRWDVDEPSERGIDRVERVRLVRDDIARQVEGLAAELGVR